MNWPQITSQEEAKVGFLPRSASFQTLASVCGDWQTSVSASGWAGGWRGCQKSMHFTVTLTKNNVRKGRSNRIWI